MLRVVGLLLIGLMLMGCVRSLEPVLKPEQSVKIPEIVGKWVSAKNEKETLDVSPADDGYKVVYVNEKGEAGTFTIRMGRVGNMLIADVMPAEPPANSGTQMALTVPVHMAFVVTQVSPQLAGKVLKPEWFKDYIAAHPTEIATVKADGEGIISASTEQIQQFLTKHADDEKAWSDEALFMRPPAGAKPINPAAQPKP